MASMKPRCGFSYSAKAASEKETLLLDGKSARGKHESMFQNQRLRVSSNMNDSGGNLGVEDSQCCQLYCFDRTTFSNHVVHVFPCTGICLAALGAAGFGVGLWRGLPESLHRPSSSRCTLPNASSLNHMSGTRVIPN
eukprot:1661579-Amphidinium_carterae.1